jgi:CBS domain-containing protein
MSRYVHEVMCSQLFYLNGEEPYVSALLGILSLGISGAPVLDSSGIPIGVVSLRDLVGSGAAATVHERMTSPPILISRDATIEAAATRLAEHGIHRLVVVDDAGIAVGIVSALDLVRAFAGLPARHPVALLDEPGGGLVRAGSALAGQCRASTGGSRRVDAHPRAGVGPRSDGLGGERRRPADAPAPAQHRRPATHGATPTT